MHIVAGESLHTPCAVFTFYCLKKKIEKGIALDVFTIDLHNPTPHFQSDRKIIEHFPNDYEIQNEDALIVYVFTAQS